MFRIDNRPARFFIIEDNLYIVDSYASIIRQEGGVFLDCAVNTTDATAKISQLESKIDIITLDLNLGKNVSLSILEFIKKKLPHVPVIIISGFSTESNVKESYLLGTSFFLAKPCSCESFIKTASSAINLIHAGTVHQEPVKIKIAIYEVKGQISSYISQMNIYGLFQFVVQSDVPHELKQRLQLEPDIVDMLIVEYDMNETSAIEELFLYASSQPKINQVILASNNDHYSRRSPVLAEFNEFIRMTSQDSFSSDLISHVFAYTKNQSRLNPT